MLASSGEITEPCPVPVSLTVTTPSSRMPALSHFWIRRMMRRSPIRCEVLGLEPEPIREPEEILLVDRVQQCAGRPLDDFVFQGGYRERALSAIRLWYVPSPGRQRPICSPMNPGV